MTNSKSHKKKHEKAKAAAEKSEDRQEEAPAREEPLRTQLLRLQADFDNFRKRTTRERVEWYQRANEDLVTELLSVLDHFELGLKTAVEHHSDSAVIEGLQLVYDQLMTTLKKFDLSPIDAEGRPFDPHQHEAMTHIPSEEYPADTVVAQTRRGYKLGAKLLRPAQVVVSSGSAGGGEHEHPPSPDGLPPLPDGLRRTSRRASEEEKEL